MTDRFEDLRMFVAIAETKQLSAAAGRLGVVRSAVSRRLQELEQRLGVRLVTRTTRRLALTDAGHELYQRGLQILHDLSEVEASLASAGGAASGRLRVTAPLSWSVLHLVPALDTFTRAYPDLQLDLYLTDRMVDLVEEGFDVAIRISSLRDSAYTVRRLAPTHHVVVGAPAYFDQHGVPRVPHDLRDHVAILYGHATEAATWAFVDPSTQESLRVTVPSQLRINNGEALREMALSGAGVICVPDFVVCNEVRTGRLQVVLSEFARPPLHLHALYVSRRHQPARVRVFIDFLVARFAENATWRLA